MNAKNFRSRRKQRATLRALVSDFWGTSPGFLPQQLPALHRALCFGSWWWAWGLCGKHHSLPSHVRGRCAYPYSSSAPAFTREKEPLLLCFLPSLAPSLVAVHPFPSENALFWALIVKLGLFLNCFFYAFVKDLSWLQILYKIPLQLWFISLPFLLQYFRSGLSLLALTSLHTFYIVFDRLHFIAGVLFLKGVDWDTIAKRKTFVKVQLVMHSYHPLRRFNWK